MSGWVLDASMALAWGLPDERSPAADRFWSERDPGTGLFVPALWWFECANALLVARRRERLGEDQAHRLSRLLAALPVATAPVPSGQELLRLHAVAWNHGLSAYDAAYVDLARTLTAGLATLDERLAAAARHDGIRVWQP